MENPLKPKQWLINGVAVTIPLVITIVVLLVVFNFILGILSPVVALVAHLWPDEPSMVVLELVTLVLFVVFFLVVGIVSDLTPGHHVTGAVDSAISAIPGLSLVYTSVRRASTMLVDEDEHQFQEAKLVEFPHENAYMVGFLVGEVPDEIEDELGVGEMVTIMVPLAPNPTTNGFILHVPVEHVHDTDMTVEDAIQSVVTLGVDTREEENDPSRS